jgi:hypothetical protein
MLSGIWLWLKELVSWGRDVVFPQTEPAISDWIDRLPSAPIGLDDAEEIECARHPCPYIIECAKLGICLRA